MNLYDFIICETLSTDRYHCKIQQQRLALHHTTTNVIGAIRGMHSRYREDESLLSLNIVEMKKVGNDIKLYGITSFGKEILETIRER